MNNFKFDYDSKYDDLFVYTNEKSDGSIEIGEFVFDFTNEGKLVAFQIQNASKNIKKISDNHSLDLSELTECMVDINKIKDFLVLKLTFVIKDIKVSSNLIIPSIKEKNPSLVY